jgi:hypothetical protein
MADEQPNSPSTDVQPSDGAAGASGSDQPAEEQPSRSWWDRILNREPPRKEAATASGDQAATSGTSGARTVSEEELQRLVQSEADRREHRRQEEEKRAARKKLRDTDPFAYAEEERKDEQVQSATGDMEKLIVGIGNEHDRVSIDPLMDILPKEERERILKLEGAGTGLTGRKLVVTEGLKALERHWRAEGAKDAEAKLRRNPAFRKQVLAESRGGTVEPELLPAASASAPESSVSALLRERYGIGAR